MPPQQLDYKKLLKKAVNDVDSLSSHRTEKVAKDFGGWAWQMGARLFTLNLLSDRKYRFTTMRNAVKHRRGTQSRHAENARSRLNSLLTYITLLDVKIKTENDQSVLFVNYLDGQLKEIQDITELDQPKAQVAIERLFDELYLVFERLSAQAGSDDGMMHELKKRLHAAAREFGQPCRIANMQKLAYASVVDGQLEKEMYQEVRDRQTRLSKEQASGAKVHKHQDSLRLFREDESVRRAAVGLSVAKTAEEAKAEDGGDGSTATDLEASNFFKADFRQAPANAFGRDALLPTSDNETPSAKKTKYAVVWRKGSDNKAFFERLDSKRKLTDNAGKSEALAYNQGQSEAFAEISSLTPKQKAAQRKKKARLDVIAKIFTLFVCIGEAFVPAVLTFGSVVPPIGLITLPWSIAIGISAFIVNYALFGGAARAGIKEIMLGKLYKDEHGRELPPVKILGKEVSKKTLMKLTAAFCIAAAIGYMCLSFSAGKAGFAFLSGALPYVAGAVIGVSCLIGLGMVFYKSFGQFIKEGGFTQVKQYFSSRFGQKVSAGQIVKNAVKFALGASLTLASLALVSVYMTGLVAKFLANPIGNNPTAAVGMGHMVAAGFINVMALVPNMVFVTKAVFGAADAIVDGVCSLGKVETWRNMQPSRIVQKFKQNPIRLWHVVGAKVQQVGVALGMVTLNSLGQASLAASNPTVQAVTPGAAMKFANTGVFFAYSAAPLSLDAAGAVAAAPSVTDNAIELDTVQARAQAKTRGASFGKAQREGIASNAGRLGLFQKQVGQAAPQTFANLDRGEGEVVQSLFTPTSDMSTGA